VRLKERLAEARVAGGDAADGTAAGRGERDGGERGEEEGEAQDAVYEVGCETPSSLETASSRVA
jgi:hypothetical protein